MGRATPGLYRVLLTPLGELANVDATSEGLVSLGLRAQGTFKWGPYLQAQEAMGGPLRNMILFEFEGECFQSTARDFQWMLNFAQNGCDIQVVANPQNSTADSGGLFNFTGDYATNPYFKYTLRHDKRSLMVQFKRAMPYDQAVAFIDAADAAGSITPAIKDNPVSGGNERGQLFANQFSPFFVSAQAPSGTDLFTVVDIWERELSFESIGEYSPATQIFYPDFVKVYLYLKSRNATQTKVLELLNKAVSPSVKCVEKQGTSYTETYNFAANTLLHQEKFEVSDTDRYVESEYTRNLTPGQISFAYGTGNGGDGVDDGEEGFDEAEARKGATVTVTA